MNFRASKLVRQGVLAAVRLGAERRILREHLLAYLRGKQAQPKQRERPRRGAATRDPRDHASAIAAIRLPPPGLKRPQSR